MKEFFLALAFAIYRIQSQTAVFEKRGIPALVHEDFFRLFVALAFANGKGHETSMIQLLFNTSAPNDLAGNI
ncbi:MAG: hypothetical protein KJ929_00140 [Euryarchaeota archaeon]|nr:hypothetical protein [Euryarchaeota archaeon]